MRCFIAVNIPGTVKELLNTFQNGLRQTSADVKWVDSDKFHLTLKFLGEIEDKNIADIVNGIAEALKGRKVFNLSFFEAGVFPDTKNPRIIWAGVKEGKEEIEEIAKNIEENLYKAGFKKDERSFNAHLTLGRVRSLKNKDALIKQILENEKKLSGVFEVKSIELVESKLHPSGPEYKCIKSISI
jgi:2'-5' RNA ligase